MSNRKKKISISTVEKFVENITIQRKKISEKNPARYRKEFPLLFRGMGDAQQCLCPGIFRKARDEAFEAPLYYVTEKELFRIFRKEAMAYEKDIMPSDYIAWYELAQHHGMPTRFLDWTYNPLVALYFACTSADEKNAAVWVLNEDQYKERTQSNINGSENKTVQELITGELSGESCFNYPIIYVPYYRDLRMSVQSSVFMAWGSIHESLEDIIKNEPLNYAASNDDSQTEILFKTEVKSKDKPVILSQLDCLGINKRTLFPGLDGLGQYLETKYRLSKPEIADSVLGL